MQNPSSNNYLIITSYHIINDPYNYDKKMFTNNLLVHGSKTFYLVAYYIK